MPQRRATILGDFDRQKIGHSRQHFIDRGILLDCRGTVEISATSMWGYCVTVLTGSHDPVKWGKVVYKSVVVEDGTWICSNVLLFNCRVGEGSLVASGAVVRSRDVPPWTMVEGNPAKIVARYDRAGRRWDYFEEPQDLERHQETED